MAPKYGKVMTAFLIHPRESIRQDLLMNKRFWPVQFVSEKTINKRFCNIPFVVGKVWRNQEHIGWTIAITMTGSEMLSRPSEARKKILDATLYAQNKLGAHIVGLGSFTGSKLTQGGEWLKKQSDVKIVINNGNDFTAFALIHSLKDVCGRKKIDLFNEDIFIIGATGSIGTAITKWLAKEGYKISLYSSSFERTMTLAKIVREESDNATIRVASNLSEMRNCGVVVVVSRSDEKFVTGENLKKNAIVYDATMPRNTSPNIIIERPDILVVDGDIMKIPGFRTEYSIGLRKQEAYACMASVFAMAHLGNLYDVVGDIQYDTAIKTEKYLDINDFPIEFASYKSFGKIIKF